MVRKINAKLRFRLRAEGMSGRNIAASQIISRNSVSNVLDAASNAGISWTETQNKTENAVYEWFFPGRGEHQSVFAQPDWSTVHKQLAKVGVTLKLLHGEYVEEETVKGQATMGYDRFCKTYHRYVLEHSATSRVEHKAGMSVEVDWSGPAMALIEPNTGAKKTVYLFVACLPFSRFAFVEACLDMKQASWLRAQVSMFEALGGSVPRIVPDNLKTGVIRHPVEGEIVLNDSYRHLTSHYVAAVLPGRVRKPKDYSEVSVIPSIRRHSFEQPGSVLPSSG